MARAPSPAREGACAPLIGFVLFLYRFGQSQGVDRNVLPPRGELASRLDDVWGYPEPGRVPFYERFSADTGHPLLLETAALHNPAVGGATKPLSDTRCGVHWLVSPTRNP